MLMRILLPSTLPVAAPKLSLPPTSLPRCLLPLQPAELSVLAEQVLLLHLPRSGVLPSLPLSPPTLAAGTSAPSATLPPPAKLPALRWPPMPLLLPWAAGSPAWVAVAVAPPFPAILAAGVVAAPAPGALPSLPPPAVLTKKPPVAARVAVAVLPPQSEPRHCATSGVSSRPTLRVGCGGLWASGASPGAIS